MLIRETRLSTQGRHDDKGYQDKATNQIRGNSSERFPPSQRLVIFTLSTVSQRLLFFVYTHKTETASAHLTVFTADQRILMHDLKTVG
jgi:hypothetical protein